MPKLVIVSSGLYTGIFLAGNTRATVVFAAQNSGTAYSANGWYVTMSISGNTLTWYAEANAAAQLNYTNTVYRYIALG